VLLRPVDRNVGRPGTGIGTNLPYWVIARIKFQHREKATKKKKRDLPKAKRRCKGRLTYAQTEPQGKKKKI